MLFLTSTSLFYLLFFTLNFCTAGVRIHSSYTIQNPNMNKVYFGTSHSKTQKRNFLFPLSKGTVSNKLPNLLSKWRGKWAGGKNHRGHREAPNHWKGRDKQQACVGHDNHTRKCYPYTLCVQRLLQEYKVNCYVFFFCLFSVCIFFTLLDIFNSGVWGGQKLFFF